ncbi:MAG: hypothetical protein NTZ67_07725 [Gammaproteobacteria bacterium]|nr:hypothetical protein [Gammaproteobacteria bacterium]
MQNDLCPQQIQKSVTVNNNNNSLALHFVYWRICWHSHSTTTKINQKWCGDITYIGVLTIPPANDPSTFKPAWLSQILA